MTIDVRTPEDRQRELRNISLLNAKKLLGRTIDEINYLIGATATGDRRNTLCDANIHLTEVNNLLSILKSEEKE